MTTAITKTETNSITASGFEPSNMNELLSLSETLSRSSLIPSALRGKPGDVAVILMHGRELGLTPMRSLSEIYVVDGKPSASATLKVGLCVRHPEVCKYFRAIEVTERIATYETQRVGSEPVRFSYSMDDASRAGLTGRQTWKAHPKQMLSARAKSVLATMVYPDLVGNLYDPDEAQDIVQNRPMIDVTPPPVAAPIAPPAPKVQVLPPEEAPLPGPEHVGSGEFTAAANAITQCQNLDGLKLIAKSISSVKDSLLDGEADALRNIYNARRKVLEAK